MKRILSSRRHHHVARVSIFLIMVALIAGMVGCDDGVRVYYLTMAVDPPGSGTATDVTGLEVYEEGEHVTISAVATAGYGFLRWSAPAGTFASPYVATTTFTMPAQDVTVTASFTQSVYGWRMFHGDPQRTGCSYGGTGTDGATLNWTFTVESPGAMFSVSNTGPYGSGISR